MGKVKRNIAKAAQSQNKTEATTQDKFADTQSLAQGTKPVSVIPAGRASPQLSCTILPEDKQMLNDLTIYAINKTGKPMNISSIVRALIRHASKNRDEIDWVI